MKKRVFRLVILLLVILIIAFTVFFVLNLKVGTITCESQYGPCSSSMEEKIQSLKNQNMITFRKSLKNIFKNEIFVTDYSMSFSPPRKFSVFVRERKPIVAVRFESDEQNFWLLDKDGYEITSMTSSVLPLLILRAQMDMHVGNRVPETVLFAQNLFLDLNQRYGVKTASISSDKMEVTLNQKNVILPLTGDIQLLSASLSVILSRLNSSEGDSRIKSIDLRFKNPVLKTNE